MAGESQDSPTTGAPDPTTRTTEQMLQKVDDSESEIDAKFSAIIARLDASDKATALLHEDFTRFPTEVQKEVGHLKEIFEIRLQAEKEISAIREAYRVELKADSKEALTTALAAAKEAVNAALAAAEKARDQETIRTQLANDKTEKSLKEALAQQQEVFVTTIARLMDGQNETKAGVEQLRNLALGKQQSTNALYALGAFILTLIAIFTYLSASGAIGGSSGG